MLKRSKTLKIKRYITLDAFRGFAVLLMIFISALYLLTYNIPYYLLHNQGDSFLFFDLVAPIFQFGVGASLFFFILHRRSHGFKKNEIAAQLLWRYLVLIALGFILDSITYINLSSWGVLETLGIGGILTFFLADRTNNEKILVSMFILTVYSFLYFNPIFYGLTSMPHGGPIGALSYSVISIIGFMVAEKLYMRKSNQIFFKSMLKTALVLIFLGSLLSLQIPFDKTHASPSFILAATGIVLVFYLFFFTFYKRFNYTFDRLREFGRTALTMYVIQYIFGWIFLFVLQKKQFLDFIPGLITAVAVTIFMYFVAFMLNKYKIRISF
jgi:predicted acyltransferase